MRHEFDAIDLVLSQLPNIRIDPLELTDVYVKMIMACCVY